MLIRELFDDIVGKFKSENEYNNLLIEASGKMLLLDKMLTKFINEHKKVLIFS
jgi:hypothetical protein